MVAPIRLLQKKSFGSDVTEEDLRTISRMSYIVKLKTKSAKLKAIIQNSKLILLSF